jgi:hypothetical protein
VCGKNDREDFSGIPLYLREGEFFSDIQWVLSDGAFEGDGCFICSYKNPGNNPDNIHYNLAFFEVRQGVENNYGRVGMWFPLLGNNKKKCPILENVLFLAIHAAAWLHNWIMDSKNLWYSAMESPEDLFHSYY